eukprot:Skav235797  [mRNA]  locus=scaffold1267:145879:150276:+ [translate_table: standard]
MSLTISLRRRWTALHLAAWNGHEPDSGGRTPLQVAVQKGRAEVACYLADQDADATLKWDQVEVAVDKSSHEQHTPSRIPPGPNGGSARVHRWLRDSSGLGQLEDEMRSAAEPHMERCSVEDSRL